MHSRSSQPRAKRFNVERVIPAIHQMQQRKDSSNSLNTTLKITSGYLLPRMRAIEDSRQVPVYFRHMKRINLCCTLLSALSILSAFCEGELSQTHSNKRTTLADAFRVLVIILSLMVVLCIFFFYHRLLRTRISRGLISIGTKLIHESELRTALWLEVALALLVCPPGLYVSFSAGHDVQLTLADALFCFTCIRFYHLFKLSYWRLRRHQDFFLL